MKRILYTALMLAAAPLSAIAQSNPGPWHGKERTVHYRPAGKDFVTINGTARFNRALYGGNTAFRVEAGDLPEFALYLPGMGGNLKFGLTAGTQSKWLTQASSIKATYRPGSMLYEVKDALLGTGTIQLTVLATYEQEAIIVQVVGKGIPAGVQLVTAYGGVTGKKFSRDGDIGADPESVFYLQPAYCVNNRYEIKHNAFTLSYGDAKTIQAIFPAAMSVKTGSPAGLSSPSKLETIAPGDTVLVYGKMPVKNSDTSYWYICQPGKEKALGAYQEVAPLFSATEAARKKLADRVIVNTPDPWINTLGGALSMAADAIWEDPSYLHGAIAWRMRLPAWRGAYTADPLGWHDRARTHFSSYALSQVTSPLTGPVVPDTALHLARQQEKMGNALFSSGYICRNPNGDIRPHHYDMNLVFIDQLLSHFLYTGDTAYIKQMWPVVERHLAWEKRNFDADGDGLYDAYCCIWASDALQYSGGGVTHSSSYNYRANKLAALLATIAGADPAPYQKEADKIYQALNQQLWMPAAGVYAEYKDALGKKNLHPAAALWTIYHALDSKVPDPFKAWQSLTYINEQIPHIPVCAKGLGEKDLYLLSTTNWQPYTWSINNVVLAENLHTALAYWQGNRSAEAWQLWRSALIESFYLGASPGSFQQLSFYDAMRGELYRDFADPIGIASRSLLEGLFGILPDAINDTLTMQPGWPAQWTYASLTVPDIQCSFKRDPFKDQYSITPAYTHSMNLRLLLPALKTGLPAVTVNGKPFTPHFIKNAVGNPLLEICVPKQANYVITITWKGISPVAIPVDSLYAAGEPISLSGGAATLKEVYDPQQLLGKTTIAANTLRATVLPRYGRKTLFLKLEQGPAQWWQPVSLLIKPVIQIQEINKQDSSGIYFRIYNHGAAVKGNIVINPGPRVITMPLQLTAKGNSPVVHIPAQYLITGSNEVHFQWGTNDAHTTIVNWNIPAIGIAFEKLELSTVLNAKLTQVFKQVYATPRPASPTLQLPTQGIGNWCYPLIQPELNDEGLRQLAGTANEINLDQHIPFAVPGDTNSNNILFTSQWDNYPDSVTIPLTGKASHAYLILAGTTNPMQSRMANGALTFIYTDGTADTLLLKNPENWWPVEQDYFTDGYAFTTNAPAPLRIYLKSGVIASASPAYTSLKGFTNKAVEGGAATILDISLKADKELQSVKLQALCNDVVIGLMSLTLVRN